MRKNNVRTLGKAFEFLADPELRKKEAGDAPLIIRGVEISGARFQEILWRNIRFVDCDFVGAYEIKVDMHDVEFEGCRFAGIFNFEMLRNVQFLRCAAAGGTFVVGGVDSQAVKFVDCKFIGTDADPNHWGGMGSYGETEFIRCKMKWVNVISETTHVIVDCEFEDVDCSVSKDGGGSVVLIERSKLRGTFDMRPATLQSLTIRDTVLDHLDLTDATVKGDIVMERIRGGVIKAYVKEAKSLSLRDSQISGDDRMVFEAYAGGIRSVEIDNVVFGGDATKEPVLIAGGYSFKSADRISDISQFIRIRGSTVPVLKTTYLNTRHLALDSNTIGSLNVSHGRIGKLEISGNTIARSVDFTNTQVKESKVQPLAKGQAKLDGSNVKVG